MENLRGANDQRKQKRYLTKDWIFVVCRSNSAHLGRIVDISRTGLAFHYVPQAGAEKQLDGACQLEIFENKTSCQLQGVLSKVVYNAEVGQRSHAADAFRLMRCGVEFTSLSELQLYQLDFFIRNYTVGPSNTD